MDIDEEDDAYDSEYVPEDVDGDDDTDGYSHDGVEDIDEEEDENVPEEGGGDGIGGWAIDEEEGRVNQSHPLYAEYLYTFDEAVRGNVVRRFGAEENDWPDLVRDLLDQSNEYIRGQRSLVAAVSGLERAVRGLRPSHAQEAEKAVCAILCRLERMIIHASSGRRYASGDLPDMSYDDIFSPHDTRSIRKQWNPRFPVNRVNWSKVVNSTLELEIDNHNVNIQSHLRGLRDSILPSVQLQHR